VRRIPRIWFPLLAMVQKKVLGATGEPGAGCGILWATARRIAIHVTSRTNGTVNDIQEFLGPAETVPKHLATSIPLLLPGDVLAFPLN
jgi:hypothetical protein